MTEENFYQQQVRDIENLVAQHWYKEKKRDMSQLSDEQVKKLACLPNGVGNSRDIYHASKEAVKTGME